MRILVLARSYPNSLLETMGLWTERPTCHIGRRCDVSVVSPVPYCPPLPPIAALQQYTRFRSIAEIERRNGVDVYHPRFVVGPGGRFQSVEASTYDIAIRRLVDRLHRERPFDLIHAHFIYPDGVVAHRLSRRYDIPFVVTDQAPWTPWLDSRRVRRVAVPAARAAAALTVVSNYLRATVIHYLGSAPHLRVIPNGVDPTQFRLPSAGEQRDPTRILFVGFVNYNKGVDILLDAMVSVRQAVPLARLELVGGSHYRNTRLQEEALRNRAASLGFGEAVTFLGSRPPREVARLMRTSAVLVLPSRAETFGAVLVEALASGTPIVSSQSGGPEDFVTSEIGRLVAKEDPRALADALIAILSGSSTFPPEELRAYALERFDWARIADRYVEVYDEVLARSPAP